MGEPLLQPSNALVVYGTLAPGEVNHHVVADIDARWLDGTIRGRVFETTWNGFQGFPGFHPDPDGPSIPIKVLVCDHLSRYWNRLDRFEGPAYRRVVIEVFDRAGVAPIGRAFVFECLAEND